MKKFIKSISVLSVILCATMILFACDGAQKDKRNAPESVVAAAEKMEKAGYEVEYAEEEQDSEWGLIVGYLSCIIKGEGEEDVSDYIEVAYLFADEASAKACYDKDMAERQELLNSGLTEEDLMLIAIEGKWVIYASTQKAINDFFA
ncbi:MAG: hypothetical protein ACI4SK_03215 [Christensenellales bacterium]